MAVEIERKFLVEGDAWRSNVRRSIRMCQAYLGGEQCSTRVRIEDDRAFLNVKSRTLGAARLEFEYPIPLADAEQLLRELAAGRPVEKVRHEVLVGTVLFEVDEFLGENAPLVVAEVELERVDQEFPRPDWLGAEVTDDPRYYNVMLAQHPYSRWGRR